MDWRERRYWAVKLPSGRVHNVLIKIMKSIPHVKVHPAKYPSVKIDGPIAIADHRFNDEQLPRGYHNIVVSVWGYFETRCLLYLLTGFSLRESDFNMSYLEILPKKEYKT